VEGKDLEVVEEVELEVVEEEVVRDV